jgi:hypothetical protein
MNQFQAYLPEHWNEWIRQFSLSASDGKYDELGAGTFRGNVRLVFDDGSNAFFEGAFFVEDESREELAVFTEHCGYHVFSSRGMRAEYFEWTEPRVTFADGAPKTQQAESGRRRD